ncbi:hypothetical protein BRAS3843_120054 [Bradyrhizobium sp. STM 3843]|uniref:hypothetical protein n=1 Tax=Bradyrhizobium sp. STM 3843 TaxID=551947 RepID=UPI00024066D4|nr:hypothetical protein [Bradyrhizobium sp. STM 3843]CCE04882.1 hypothetical protein BRAS3843_120054 [Bradyrhizobium sp. STM 3843]
MREFDLQDILSAVDEVHSSLQEGVEDYRIAVILKTLKAIQSYIEKAEKGGQI